MIPAPTMTRALCWAMLAHQPDDLVAVVFEPDDSLQPPALQPPAPQPPRCSSR